MDILKMSKNTYTKVIVAKLFSVTEKKIMVSLQREPRFPFDPSSLFVSLKLEQTIWQQLTISQISGKLRSPILQNYVLECTV